jgi:hypothetical protein
MYLTVFPSFPLLLPGEGAIVRQVIIIKKYILSGQVGIIYTINYR